MRIIESANPRPLNLLAIGPGGLVAAACATFGAPGDVEVWESTSGKLVITLFEDAGPATGVAFTPDGKRLLKSAGGFGISACDTSDWQFYHRLDHDSSLFSHLRNAQFAIASAGDYLLATDYYQLSSGRLSCWRLGSEQNHAPRHRWQDESSKTYSRYAKPTISSEVERVAVWRADSTYRPASSIEIRDAHDGRLLLDVPLDAASPVQQLAFTADGAKLLVRTDSRTVQMFDANTGAPAGELVHPGRPYVTGVAVHPRGALACARTNGAVTFWNAETREQLRTLDWKAGKLVSVAFSPDGALGAAGTEDGKVVVWDVDI